jgi:subtilisin family serine protease
VTAAGNEAQRYNQSTWSDKNKNNFLEFSGRTEDLRIVAGPGGYVRLRWDDSFGKSNHDYDLYVVDSGGNIVGKSEGYQTGSQDPFEEIVLTNGTPGIATVEVRHDPGSPTKSNQKLWLYVGGDSAMDPAYQTKAMTLTLPGDSKTALSVGAVKYSTKKLEPFSSRGPTADNRVKPDLTAPDGVSAASWDGAFYGTSAAAPHAAGAAALILSHNPGLSASALKAALMKATASGGNSKNNDQGYGLIDLSKATN